MKKILILCLCSISTLGVSAQEQSSKEIEKQLNLILKESAQPDVYIDDKKYPYEIVNLIDLDKIKSVTVVKNTPQLKKIDSVKQTDYQQYGDAPNGLILIETKKPGVEIRYQDASKSPLIVVDGEVTDKKNLFTIDKDKIESIKVLKDEAALKEYNAPNGVIIITMKK